MSEKLNMDKLIREKVENFSVAPPPHLWNNIQEQMAIRKRKKRMAYVGWISAAAVVVFAFIAGWYLSDQSSEILPEMAEKQISVQSQEQDDVGMVSEEESTGSLPKMAQEEKSALQIAEVRKEELPEDENSNAEEGSAVASRKQKSGNYTLLARIEAILGWDYSEPSLAERRIVSSPDLLSESDKMLIAGNVKNTGSQKQLNKGWIVGMHVAPGYSSHTASHKESYSQNMYSSNSDGNSNVGAGFSIQYKTGKRFRVESGVYYAQNGHSLTSSPNLFAYKENSDFLLAPGIVSGVERSFSNAVRMDAEGISMNSKAGIININATPKGAEIASNLETLNGSYENTLVTDGELAQVFEFVEVPLYLRYSIVDKKIGIEVLGGINAGFVVGNSAYIDNQYGMQKIGSTEDISDFNVSGTVGVGVNYRLGKHFSLALEPRLNYYLNSINTSSSVDFKPYRIGLYTGLYYEF